METTEQMPKLFNWEKQKKRDEHSSTAEEKKFVYPIKAKNPILNRIYQYKNGSLIFL